MHPLLFVALAFVLSAGITALIIPKIILISFKKKLFDEVDERKVHQGIVPRLGGVAFTPAIVMSMAMLLGLYALVSSTTGINLTMAPMLSLSLCALMLLYLEGITDDLIGIGYKVKFVCQIISALLIVVSGVWINDFNGLFGIHEIPWYVGMPFTTVLLVYVINAINLIDGIDGLASGLSMVALFFLGCLFSLSGDVISAVIAFATVGTLVPFFIYNVFGRAERHSKVFMGDCGSQTIGLLLGMLAVKISMSDTLYVNSLPEPLVIAFSVLMIPCLDVIRVMIGRMRKGKNPFLPDKTHFHHKFLALGMSHRTAMVTILMIDAFFIMLNLGMVMFLNINVILLMDILMWCAMHTWINKMVIRIKKQS